MRVAGSGQPSKFTFTGQYDDSYGTISFPAREYSPLLGRFLSADSIVPRPGDPQSLNRYSYTRNNPVSRIDKDGHADEDPLKDFLCKYNLAACLPETQLTPQGGGEVLNVNDGSVEVVPGPGGQVMAKGSGKGVGQKVKDAAVSAATKLCQGILAIICGGAGAKAAEEGKKVIQRTGKASEDFLRQKLGGTGSFRAGGREFDTSINNGNTWVELKSGLIDMTKQRWSSMQSQIGQQMRIARDNLKEYELHIIGEVPDYVRDWLVKKGITFVEHGE